MPQFFRRLTAPFRVHWIRSPTDDQFEGACAAFWEAHQEPMRRATIATSGGYGTDEQLRDAIRIGMKAALNYLEEAGAISPNDCTR